MLIPKAHKVTVYSKLFQGELQRAAGLRFLSKNAARRSPLNVAPRHMSMVMKHVVGEECRHR
jgi:hypothetical protein